LLIVTPPYNKPSIAGLKKHFSAIADAVTVPLCLYHVPGRTAQRLTALQLAEVVKSHSRILAVKEASGDITLFTQVRSLLPKHLILSGDDLTYLASLAVGGDGCISVASNVLPSMMVGLTKMFWNGQVEESLRNNLRFFPIFEALFCETNPGPVKWMLNQRAQISSDHMRAPLTTLEDSSKAICRRALEQVGL
jgi:4-hydroxy-tetrahydrodipicolinate synthase